jgi:hypothetical protein
MEPQVPKTNPSVYSPALLRHRFGLTRRPGGTAPLCFGFATLAGLGSSQEGRPPRKRGLALGAGPCEAIPGDERVVVIEDTPELQICRPNIVPASSKSHTFKASVSFDELLRDALRFRPDRIILGEVRGSEARTLLDSFNTGHAGSLATIHANSAAKALRRFANLVLRSHPQALLADVEAEIGEAVDYVVHLERQRGCRAVREVLHISDYNLAAQQFVTEIAYDADTDRFENTAQSVFPILNASPWEAVNPCRLDSRNHVE